MDLTIIVPTYNEKDVLTRLVAEITQEIGKKLSYEILFVDDSNDETPQVLEQLSHQTSTVHYLHRNNERGLASAVVAGFKIARGDSIIVMDADLQHPPSLIPMIAERLKNVDIVIPSRFISGGSDGGLNPVRKLISFTARSLGRLSIKRLRPISDCTGGYFGLKRSVIEGVALNPVGWKILIEVLVKGNYHTVHEIPYSFHSREAGASKMSLKEQWNYLVHIARLVRNSPEDLRFYSFCLVGMLGVFVNMFALTILVNLLGFYGMAASAGASVIAMAHNFVLNDRITWRDHKPATTRQHFGKLLQFIVICSVGILITALFVESFLSLNLSIYLGQLIGIMVATYWNFAVNNRFTWSNKITEESEDDKLVVTQECSREIF